MYGFISRKFTLKKRKRSQAVSDEFTIIQSPTATKTRSFKFTVISPGGDESP